ncbi:MAG TPA: four-carbon acid sugar kinase family protein [Lachnospiraceae bacterium]
MPLIGVVADDLTGATTTGVLLARSKARTAVFFNEKAALKSKETGALDAVLISSNSRPLPANEAYSKVTDATNALKNMGVLYFSKRIDTTLRGGVGVEIDAMLDVLENDSIAVVVSSMPQSRRILVGGYSIIDGVALSETPVAKDVRTPVYESYVPGLLEGQSRRKVGVVGLDKVLKGKIEIKKALKNQREKGAGIIVVDAITLDDVELIAKACVELRWNVLAVDPGPFTAKLAYCRELIEKEEANIPKQTEEGKGKTVLAVVGSASPVTKKQIGIFCEDKRHLQVSVDAKALIDGGESAQEEIKRAVSIIKDLLKENPRAIVIETALHGPVLNLEEEDKVHGYAHGMSADRINASLGVVVRTVLEEVGREKIAGIYATGGDTMVNVCYHLEVECLELIDYVIAQTDVGRMLGKYEGMPIIGKGGLTGHDNIVFEIVERLFKEASRKI